MVSVEEKGSILMEIIIHRELTRSRGEREITNTAIRIIHRVISGMKIIKAKMQSAKAFVWI